MVHVRGQQWPDHVTRNSPEESPASRAKGANLPGIKEFFDAMTGLVSTDERSDWDRGALPSHSSQPPRPKAQAREEHDMTDTTAYGREQT